MNIEHILVPTDLSPESLRPLQAAAQLAKGCGAKLTLFSVVPDLQVTPHGAAFAPPLSDPSVAGRVEEARKELERIAGDITDVECGIEARAAVDTAQAIIDAAGEVGANLIAISTHGHTGWRRLALGSVAEQVVRRSAVPVLTFQRPEEE